MTSYYLFKRIQALKAGVSQTIDDIQAKGEALPPMVLGRLNDTEANLSDAIERLDQAAANRGCSHPSLRNIGGRLQCRRCQTFLVSEELKAGN